MIGQLSTVKTKLRNIINVAEKRDNMSVKEYQIEPLVDHIIIYDVLH